MFSISFDTANAIYSIANVLLVAGAIAALVGTVGVFWSGGIRERYADERIAANEAETAKAKAETAQALLEQERLKGQMAWRRVSTQQAQKLIGSLQGTGIELWLTFVGDDPESSVFREDLNRVLGASGVKTNYFSGYAMAVGLSICGGSSEQRRTLLEAFHGAGLPLVENCHKEGFMKNKLEILVGSKPPPDFQP